MGVIRIVRAIASMKASSERYKSESRIAVGYVNRMQIPSRIFCEKTERSTPALLSKLIADYDERAQVAQTSVNSILGLLDGGLARKPDSKTQRCARCYK